MLFDMIILALIAGMLMLGVSKIATRVSWIRGVAGWMLLLGLSMPLMVADRFQGGSLLPLFVLVHLGTLLMLRGTGIHPDFRENWPRRFPLWQLFVLITAVAGIFAIGRMVWPYVVGELDLILFVWFYAYIAATVSMAAFAKSPLRKGLLPCGLANLLGLTLAAAWGASFQTQIMASMASAVMAYLFTLTFLIVAAGLALVVVKMTRKWTGPRQEVEGAGGDSAS